MDISSRRSSTSGDGSKELPALSKGRKISRDKIWEEMDKKYNLTKRKHAAVQKLKQINKVAKTNLDTQLSTMTTTFAKRKRQLTKETRAIEQELTQIKTDRKLPPIPNSSSVVPLSPVPEEQEEMVIPVLDCNECRFGISKRRCKNFPCFLPQTYTSIGFQMASRSYSSLPNYKEMLGYSQGLRPPTRKKQPSKSMEEQDTKRQYKTPRLSVHDKERGLKQLVKEMRQRNEKNKPRDWAVNYGEPLPRRIILKPIIPSAGLVV